MYKKLALGLIVLYFINTFFFNGGIKSVDIPLPTTTEILGTIKSVKDTVVKDEVNAYPTKPDSTVAATVVRVVDGDTIVVASEGDEVKVRLIGVNTPETVDPNSPVEEYGKEASDYTKGVLSEGLAIELEYDVQQLDQYGRHLAYVWLGDEMFNVTLVKEGYAQVATFPPNVKYEATFIKYQEEAMSQSKGLWSL